MPIPNLEDLTPMLDRLCRDYLGEVVEYAVDGVNFVQIRGHVDYRDAIKAMEIAQAIEQDIKVALLKVDVPNKPTKTARVRLGKLPGRLFRPIGDLTDAAGTEWHFEVKDVANG